MVDFADFAFAIKHFVISPSPPARIGNLSLFQIVRRIFAKKSNLCLMFCPIFAIKRRKSSILSLILPFYWYNISLIVHRLKICAKIATKIFLESFRSSPVRFSYPADDCHFKWLCKNPLISMMQAVEL